MMDWHRLFGLALLDYFSDSPWKVELEIDLSWKQQFLDMTIIRRGQGIFSERLPDGLEDMADYNLLTYRSMHQPLDDWVLKELTGHFVNYRKLVSPSLEALLPEEAFRLYGISTRYPNKLSGQVELKPRQAGVYEVRRGTDVIRIIVLNEVAEEAHNSIWQLFSAVPERVRRVAAAYRPRSRDISTLLYQLFEKYQQEGVVMPYTMEDFRRDFTREHLHLLTAEERLQGLAAEERLRGLPAEERLKELSLEEIRAYLARLQAKQQPGPSSEEASAGNSS